VLGEPAGRLVFGVEADARLALAHLRDALSAWWALHAPEFYPDLRVLMYAVNSRSSASGMIPPQCGMLTIGARPMTLPERMTAMILASVSNSCRKSAPESGGIVLSGDCGLGTPPRPFGP